MKFYKLEATQNDFIITIDEKINSDIAYKLCKDHTGIIADGLINIDKNYNVSIFNKDGSKANMCGNGLRCVSYVLSMLNKKINNTVYINQEKIELKQLSINESMVEFKGFCMLKSDNGYFVNIKNNHFIKIIKKDPFKYKFTKEDKEISNTNKCNVHVIQVLNKNEFKIKSYEYGVKETQSCGSGAISSFYLLNELELCDNEVTIYTLNDILHAKKIYNKYYLSGPVKYVYSGEVKI